MQRATDLFNKVHCSLHIFEQGLLEAAQKEQDLLNRLAQLPSGKQKAKK
ncbi:hypothetical protein [Desulfosporosinus sp. OT]|nr:hypothetical protein [Desulfosporosinus sp. OT]EGW35942.1 hypothetical protein DOT_6180 [Desulfosporosinus sp. OT]